MFRWGLALAVISTSLSAGPAVAATGDVVQKPGTAGCVSETGTGGACQDGVALDGPQSPTVSPDGTSVYVPAQVSDAVAVFDRDPSTGTLTQKLGTAGCVSETGTGGACQDGVALDMAFAVEVSPDGTSVYVASPTSDAVTIFDRDPGTGAITQKPGTAGCVSETGTSGACQDGVGLNGARALAISPDGESLYVASIDSDAVAIFDRDTATGAITQKPGTAGCVSETGTAGACQDGVALDGVIGVAEAQDGTSVYAVSSNSDATVIFDRDTATGALTQKSGTAGCVSETGTGGACQDGVGLDFAQGVTPAPDGSSVYVASSEGDTVVIFDRGPGGALSQKPGTAGCVSETGTAGACQDGVALDGALSVAVSAEGKSIYSASVTSDALTIFDRDPATGSITQKPGTAGCVSDTGTSGACQDGVALDGPRGVTVDPNGRSVYMGMQSVDSVAIFDREPEPLDPPTITDTDPDSPADDESPEVKGTVGGGTPTTVRIYKDNPTCTGTSDATGTVSEFTGSGITVPVSDGSTTDLRATAVDSLNNESGCSAPFSYVEMPAPSPPPPPSPSPGPSPSPPPAPAPLQAGCFGLTPTVTGTSEGDVLTGTAGDDVIVGLGGDDEIRGGAGDDRICGGAGDDRVSAGDGEDRVAGAEGADELLGGGGPDHLLGLAGTDRIDGEYADDDISGGDDRDRLDGGRGTDTTAGGEGVDSCFAEHRSGCEVPKGPKRRPGPRG